MFYCRYSLINYCLHARVFCREYQDNIVLVDQGVKQIVQTIEGYYRDNQNAYVFTADHGMTSWGESLAHYYGGIGFVTDMTTSLRIHTLCIPHHLYKSVKELKTRSATIITL